VEIHEELEASGLTRPAPVPLPTRRRNRLDMRHAPGIAATGPDAIAGIALRAKPGIPRHRLGWR
jgi:hypothetical protein